jgi:hypothetical protein
MIEGWDGQEMGDPDREPFGGMVQLVDLVLPSGTCVSGQCVWCMAQSVGGDQPCEMWRCVYLENWAR